MSAFTDAEIEFVNSQRLGRIATVGADGMPHVMPVAVFYDPDADALVIGANVEFGEAVMISSKKFRDAQRRPKAAVVIDDPGPRILEVRRQAETHLDGGEDAGRRLGALSASPRRGYASARAASWPWALTVDGSSPPHATLCDNQAVIRRHASGLPRRPRRRGCDPRAAPVRPGS